ncbi:MaoC/PaaZ C-terminal domain-containing protein [Pseudomonas sp. KNUC1026]|uniref:MaoC/PaaZ C-terminal domain-containing protein n=1 Tax=Pseudomonas sp. KNUC1026 TaxID=2893890 RepID=UPI001F2011B0|nr:MaoC/PaaZ C-terminal domain-containing protein [Pseudomonas sp. KNUC1026]UFH49051.1 acyl dehydratase [Pseudomonas sp. KNUC1026]
MTQWQTLDQPPATAGLYARAALRQRVTGNALPDIGLRCVLAPDAVRLGAYRQVCGYDNDGLLPATYPQVLAFNLQLALLTDPGFPYPLAGLVQLAERLRLHRPLGAVNRVSASVSVQGLRPHEHGAVFTLVTRIDDALGLLWEAEADLLCRKAQVDGQSLADPQPADLPADEVAHWLAGKDIGRQYARVAGDFNPIHLGQASARLFGFKQAIAPGMWALARALAALGSRVPAAGCEIQAQFLKPISLPSEVVLKASSGGEHGCFSLTGGDGSLHLAGLWQPLG